MTEEKKPPWIREKKLNSEPPDYLSECLREHVKEPVSNFPKLKALAEGILTGRDLTTTTVGQVLAMVMVMQAIKGEESYLIEVLNRLEK